MLSIVDSGLWQPVKNMPYKNGVAAYGVSMADLTGVASYGAWHKSAML